MWSVLESIFTELETEKGTPFNRQGSFSEEETLPESFYTFWNVSSNLDGYYGNVPTKCIWEWRICYYTSNPELIYAGLEDFLNKAKEVGFIIEDKGRDVPCNEPNYCGRYTTIQFVEILQKEKN